jgi:ferredoxin
MTNLTQFHHCHLEQSEKCGLCREVCPERAVHPKIQDIHHMYEVIESECTRCGDCLPGALKEFEPTGISR